MRRVLLLWQQTIHGEPVFPLIAKLAVLRLRLGLVEVPRTSQGQTGVPRFAGLSFLWWLAALCAVTKPPYMFPHYYLLMMVPTGLLASAVVAVWSDGGAELEPPHAGRCSPKLLWSTATALVVLQLVGLQAFAAPWKRQSESEIDSANFRSWLADQILRDGAERSRFGDLGLVPLRYVAVNLMPASAFAIGHYVISPHPQRDYFSPHFFGGHQTFRPEIFVDAVTPLALCWRDWSEKDRIKSFPELAQFIHQNYHVAMVYPPNSARSSFRVFVLNSTPGAPPANPGTESKP